jgi:hypothetical protein
VATNTVGQTILNIMKIQFANGFIYEATDVDEAISKCLADGNDPYKPVVLEVTPVDVIVEESQDKIELNDEHRE